jgi:glucosamine--fructose-6-phosphate aminotransferase (isomerizing)
MGKSYLETEIAQQPEVIGRLLEEERVNIMRAAEAIRAHAPRFVYFAARGSSDNAARYGQYLFGAAHGLPVGLATPSLFTLYRQPPRLDEALVLGVSQSGQSPDIVAVLEEGSRQGALTLAITNDPNSRLAQAARHTIRLLTGPEQSVAATKTYTASLAVLALLSAALAENEEYFQALDSLPDLLARVLASTPDILQGVERYRAMETCVVLSRGYNYATGFEIALKLKELTYVLAEPYSSADFQHGPLALVERGFPVVAVVPEGEVSQELAAMVKQLREQGAELLIISGQDEALGLAHTPMPLPPGVPEWLSPLVAVVPGQLLALGLALAKGFDPDHPRSLHKVTLTW